MADGHGGHGGGHGGGHEKHGGGHGHGETRREFLFGLFSMFTSVFTKNNLEGLLENLNLFTPFLSSTFKKGGGGGGHGGSHGGGHGGGHH